MATIHINKLSAQTKTAQDEIIRTLEVLGIPVTNEHCPENTLDVLINVAKFSEESKITPLSAAAATLMEAKAASEQAERARSEGKVFDLDKYLQNRLGIDPATIKAGTAWWAIKKNAELAMQLGMQNRNIVMEVSQRYMESLLFTEGVDSDPNNDFVDESHGRIEQIFFDQINRSSTQPYQLAGGAKPKALKQQS